LMQIKSWLMHRFILEIKGCSMGWNRQLKQTTVSPG